MKKTCFCMVQAKTTLFILTALSTLLGVSHAQLTSNTMMKIVTRDTSPDIPHLSFAALPKTLYRMGQTYGRLEEQPDPAQGIHGLIIVAEPNVWMVNLFDSTGKRIVDTGPTQIFHASIFSPNPPASKPILSELEFGMEYEFLRKHGAVQSEEEFNGTTCDKQYLDECIHASSAQEKR